MTEMVRYKHLLTFQETARLNKNKGLESEKSLHPNGATVRSGK